MTRPSSSLLHSSDLWGQFSALWRFKLFWRGVFCGSTARRWLVQSVAILSLLLVGLPAQAADYIFSTQSGPANWPDGCSRTSTSSYTCGAVSLSGGDTISIGATKPATITFTGAFTTAAGNLINTGGSASDLTLIVTGVFTLGANTVINANATGAAAVNFGLGSALGGNLTTTGTAGVVTLGVNSTVGGYIRTGDGAVSVSDASTIGGDIASQVGDVTLGRNVKVGGDLRVGDGNVSIGDGSSACGSILMASSSPSRGFVTLQKNIKVGGDIRSTPGSITADAGSTVGGSIIIVGVGAVRLAGSMVGGNISTSQGAVNLSDSRVRGSVTSSSGAIERGTSVVNDTTLVIPPVCSGKAIYRREMY